MSEVDDNLDLKIFEAIDSAAGDLKNKLVTEARRIAVDEARQNEVSSQETISIRGKHYALALERLAETPEKLAKLFANASSVLSLYAAQSESSSVQAEHFPMPPSINV